MPRRKGDSHTAADFTVEPAPLPVKPKDALIAHAAGLCCADDISARKGAVAVLADYFGAGVWELDDAAQDRKIRYLAERINAFIRRNSAP